MHLKTTIPVPIVLRIPGLVAGCALVFGLFPVELRAQGGPSPQPQAIQAQKVADGLFLLRAGRHHAAAFITDLGVVIVDPGAAERGQEIQEAVQKLTKQPVIALVNTHAHPDHTGANDRFGTAVDIIAHENTRLNMERLPLFVGARMNFLPKLMFKDRMSIGAGRYRMDLYHFGAAHTNGDVWIVFPALGIAYAGDMFPGMEMPVVDGDNGGSGLAFPASLERALKVLGTTKVILTSHSGAKRTADLVAFISLTVAFRDFVVDAFNHGLSVDEVVARWPSAAPPQFQTGPPEQVRANVEYMFGELVQ